MIKIFIILSLLLCGCTSEYHPSSGIKYNETKYEEINLPVRGVISIEKHAIVYKVEDNKVDKIGETDYIVNGEEPELSEEYGDFFLEKECIESIMIRNINLLYLRN